MTTQHLDTGTILVYERGQQKQSGCSGFGQTSFSQGKMKFNFYKKQLINKSATVIFGLISIIILSYNR